MKLAITREWFERKAELEGDHEIAAGALARDPSPDRTAEARAGPDTLDPTRVAFSSLVEYMRRKRGFSMEKLAEEAEIDLAEVVSIERDAHFRPEPRTVFQLARTFNLPNKALLQLSGNATANDAAVHEHALRFAARSGGSVQGLSREEKRALEEFIAFLAKQ
ncbi:MAG: helix-turn-helix transcriptional regulator [Caulobacter sp.]|nr:helix-turn-helix transcriptional regulator [Caulobacter sp.]